MDCNAPIIIASIWNGGRRWDCSTKPEGKSRTTLRPENVWEISDRTAFLIAMSERLCAKCGEGERLSALSPKERTTYAVDAFQREVSNGGFEQYLCNSSGALAGELLDALRAVGAEIYRPALAALPAAWLEDEEERRALRDEVLTERVSERLDQRDQRFYECSDDLEELLYRCIVQNWRSFE